MGGATQYSSVTVEAAMLTETLATVFTVLAAIAVYVIQGLSLCTIGRRRGIRNSWLAWIPIGNLWLLGSISDQYRYLVKGRINVRRKMLLGLSVATVVMYAVCAYCILLGMEAEHTALNTAAGVILMSFITIFAVLAGVIAVVVYQYMCYYDLFCSCDPANGVLFLVLSILFPGSVPFVVFAIRKRDGGMPPRKRPTPKPAQEVPAVAPPAEEEPQTPPEEKESEIEGGTPNEQTIPVADA